MGELRTLALCAGIGGLELGLRRAFPSRVVCWVERDAYAQRVLLARMRDGRLDDAPLWDDLSTFDAAEWEGRCDLVAAGFPCQPYSTAGKKLGPADIRDMWPHVARVVAEARPALVALENVARYSPVASASASCPTSTTQGPVGQPVGTTLANTLPSRSALCAWRRATRPSRTSAAVTGSPGGGSGAALIRPAARALGTPC